MLFLGIFSNKVTYFAFSRELLLYFHDCFPGKRLKDLFMLRKQLGHRTFINVCHFFEGFSLTRCTDIFFMLWHKLLSLSTGSTFYQPIFYIYQRGIANSSFTEHLIHVVGRKRFFQKVFDSLELTPEKSLSVTEENKVTMLVFHFVDKCFLPWKATHKILNSKNKHVWFISHYTLLGNTCNVKRKKNTILFVMQDALFNRRIHLDAI